MIDNRTTLGGSDTIGKFDRGPHLHFERTLNAADTGYFPVRTREAGE
jgi:hypothetical protein